MRWKLPKAIAADISGLRKIERCYAVRDINQLKIGMDGQQLPLDSASKVIL